MSSSDENCMIQHCSHSEHKLKEVFTKSKFKCGVCKCKGEGLRYRCEPCNFNIHKVCGKLPESLTSFTHPKHILSLKDSSLLFHRCGICREVITRGMAYACETDDGSCSYFLHPTCSLLPELCENHPDHPTHPLKLSYIESKEKKCDVCDKKCKLYFRYHCEICDVHIHVKCLLQKTTAGNHTIVKKHEGSGTSSWEYVGRTADVVQLAQAVKPVFKLAQMVLIAAAVIIYA